MWLRDLLLRLKVGLKNVSCCNNVHSSCCDVEIIEKCEKEHINIKT